MALGVLFLGLSLVDRSHFLLSWLSAGLGWFVIFGAIYLHGQGKLATAILKSGQQLVVDVEAGEDATHR